MGLMDVRADVYGQSSMYFSNSAKSITPDTQIPGYGLVNLRYEWLEIYGSKYSDSAFIRNLADKEYTTGGFALTGSRSEEHTSELQSLMRHSYAVFCLKK